MIVKEWYSVFSGFSFPPQVFEHKEYPACQCGRKYVPIKDMDKDRCFFCIFQNKKRIETPYAPRESPQIILESNLEPNEEASLQRKERRRIQKKDYYQRYREREKLKRRLRYTNNNEYVKTKIRIGSTI